MPHPSIALVERYLAAVSSGSVDDAVALFATDATVEDPVGSAPVVGIEAIRDFYARAFVVPMTATLSGPVRVADAAVAFPFSLSVAGGVMQIDIIDIFHLDADGRILAMRAYWGPENTRSS